MELGCEHFTVVYAFLFGFSFAETAIHMIAGKGKEPSLFLSIIFTHSRTFRHLLRV